MPQAAVRRDPRDRPRSRAPRSCSGPGRAPPRRGDGRRARSAGPRRGRRRSAASPRRGAARPRCAPSARAAAASSGGSRDRSRACGRRCRRSSRRRSSAVPAGARRSRPSASTTSSNGRITATSSGSRRRRADSSARARRRRARAKSDWASARGEPVSGDTPATLAAARVRHAGRAARHVAPSDVGRTVGQVWSAMAAVRRRQRRAVTRSSSPSPRSVSRTMSARCGSRAR